MGKPLRIALIRQRYTPYGGAERFVENALNALQKEAEIELTLITRKWDGADNPSVKKIICNPFHIGRLWRDWSFARCACRTVKHNNFDLVQSHERAPCGDIYRAGDGVHRQWLYQRSQATPWWKNLWIKISPYHTYLLWQEKRTFTHSGLKVVITNSVLVKDEISRWFPQASARIIVIYNSVNATKFSPDLKGKYRSVIRKQLGISNTTPLLLYVGSGFERKGVPLLLRVLPALSGVHLVLVGKDRREQHYRKQARSLKIDHRTHFVGPQKETRSWYGAADAFVFPSIYDPFPNTVLEAMASGLPVVVSKQCGAVDLVKDHEQGFALSPLSPDDWVTPLTQVLFPPESLKMGKSGRKVIERLSTENMRDELVALYKSIISSS